MENIENFPKELVLELADYRNRIERTVTQSVALNLECDKRMVKIALAWSCINFSVVEDYNQDDYSVWDACVFSKDELLHLSGLPRINENYLLIEKCKKFNIILPFGFLHPTVSRYLELRANKLLLEPND